MIKKFLASKSILFLLLIILFISSCNEHSIPAEEKNITKAVALQIAVNKYQKYADLLQVKNGYPRAIEKKQWRQTNWQSWTDGFFPGILWQLSTVDDDITAQAIRWTLPLKESANLPSHDVGFIINNSFGKAYRMTGDPKYMPTIEAAAQTLANRYKPSVQAIRSWDFGSYQFPVIIDNMMNLSLLFTASNIFDNEPYYSVAFNHSTTTQEHHIRDNGSSFHLVDFNIDTGDVISKSTVQGLKDDSTWARGQAWGIYGFTVAFIETGNIEFKETAITMAKFFIAHIPEDRVPFWDFNVDDRNAPKDTSAAAIAATGLWLLSNQVLDTALSKTLKDESLAITSSLLSPNYFNSDINYPALLLHATGNKPSNKEVDTSLIYADYYFIETLLLQQGLIKLPL
jgi:unsaturated chondroitin disaccharide hydrolase